MVVLVIHDSNEFLLSLVHCLIVTEFPLCFIVAVFFLIYDRICVKFSYPLFETMQQNSISIRCEMIGLFILTSKSLFFLFHRFYLWVMGYPRIVFL